MQDKSGGFSTEPTKKEKHWDKVKGTGHAPVSQKPGASDKAEKPSQARSGKWTPNQ